MSGDFTVPCIKVCAMERKTGWCLGCGRTGREITRWWNFTEAERAAVRTELPLRLAAMGLPPRGNRPLGLRRAYDQRVAAGDAILNGAAPAEPAP